MFSSLDFKNPKDKEYILKLQQLPILRKIRCDKIGNSDTASNLLSYRNMENKQAAQPPKIMQVACVSWKATDILMQEVFLDGWKSTFAMLQGYIKDSQRRLQRIIRGPSRSACHTRPLPFCIFGHTPIVLCPQTCNYQCSQHEPHSHMPDGCREMGTSQASCMPSSFTALITTVGYIHADTCWYDQ